MKHIFSSISKENNIFTVILNDDKCIMGDNVQYAKDSSLIEQMISGVYVASQPLYQSNDYRES